MNFKNSVEAGNKTKNIYAKESEPENLHRRRREGVGDLSINAMNSNHFLFLFRHLGKSDPTIWKIWEYPGREVTLKQEDVNLMNEMFLPSVRFDASGLIFFAMELILKFRR